MDILTDKAAVVLPNLLRNFPGVAYRCMNDEFYTMIYLSEGCYQIFGYRPAELLNNKLKTYTQLVHPPDLEELLGLVNAAIQKRTSFTVEYRIVTKGGQLKWVRNHGFAVYNSQNEVQYLDGFITDIHTQKTIENDLKQAAHNLAELNATKDRFFSLIAHDLQNPVYAIISLVDFLEHNHRNFTPDELSSFVNQINLSAKGIYNLLENLLDWARVQTGKVEVQREQVNLQRIILNVLEHFRPQYAEKNITFKFDPHAECQIYSDVRLVTTIVRNLISNAIKYSYPNTSVQINLTQNEDKVCVVVRDFGTGISRRHQEHLFRIDNQHRSFGTNQEQGSGLGLVLAKEFTEILGGSISVNSSLNKGSTFSLCLPV